MTGQHRPDLDVLAAYIEGWLRAGTDEPLPDHWFGDVARRLAESLHSEMLAEWEAIRRSELEQARLDVARLEGIVAMRDSVIRSAGGLREEYAGFGHPAWPDPLVFRYGDESLAMASRWYAENVARHPKIEIRRRVVSDWSVVPALRPDGGPW